VTVLHYCIFFLSVKIEPFIFLEDSKKNLKMEQHKIYHHSLRILLVIVVFTFTGQLSAQQKSHNIFTTADSDFQWEYASPESQGFSSHKLDDAVNHLSKKNTKKLLIIRNDKIVVEWFAEGFEDSVRSHGTASLAKAIVGGMSLLAAMNDGFIRPDDPAAKYIPSWRNDKVKSNITIRQLATHTSGMEDAEVTKIEQQRMVEKGLHTHMDLPGWKGHFWRQDADPFLMARDSAPILHAPGTKYAYSNPGIAMLTYTVTSSLKDSPYKDIRTYLKDKIFQPIGVEEEGYRIGYGKTFDLEGLQLVPSWGGANFTARDVARIGRLMLKGGNWQGRQLIDPSLVKEVISYHGTALVSEMNINLNDEEDVRTGINPIPSTTLGWYCNFDRIWKNIPPDAFCGGGAGNQHLFVVPSLDLIVVRFGGNLFDASKGETFWLGAEKYLFDLIVDAIERAPYPQSEVIRGLEIDWSTHQRHAPGSDNFQLTWADDDHQYGIWGDGGGFAGTNSKYRVSLGVARIEGDHENYRGYDRYGHKESSEFEAKLKGKSWAIISVKGKLYAWVHPDKEGGWGNWEDHHSESRLYVSEDKGASWQPADWSFTPEDDLAGGAILQFGKDNSGAIDNYVYHYLVQPNFSRNASGNIGELMVPGKIFLLRVHKNRIMKRASYEFLSGFKGEKPTWSKNIKDKEPIFVDENGVGTPMGISYNSTLRRYLLSTEHAQPEAGMMGIFDAPNPWGPWTTVTYSTNATWFGHDNPEEVPANCFFWCFPTKWMSSDGRSATMVFTGAGRGKDNDSFNTVRVKFLFQ
jgi:CubicO group peptidase (beta-lactamase class C family)